MASSLNPTIFNIRITEEQVVKNNITKHEVIHTLRDITNVDHRILTCPQDILTEIIKTDSPNPGAGTFISSSIEYIRITNLDTQHNLSLVVSGSNGGFSYEIKPEGTLMLTSAKVLFDISSSIYLNPGYVDPNYVPSLYDGILTDNINSILVYPISSSIDIEYTVVNS